MRLEDLGLIGNCQFSALVSSSGSVVWCCLPRFDAEPVFGKLLDPDGGEFAIEPASGARGTQRYVENTNVLETSFDAPDGRFRIVDFAPRFVQHDRAFRPTQLVRIVEPIDGAPLIRVRCDPRLGWSRRAPEVLRGSNHCHYEGFPSPLRLTTDLPLSYLGGEPFALTGRQHAVLAWGAPVEESLPEMCERFLRRTTAYWERWVKHCNIPSRYQREVIRSALVLKLHCYEDTGAIVAAMTTSLPEAPGSGRNWDYRYCWLRDAYYALNAFRLLGHFEEREHFIQYLLNIAASAPEMDLRPLYRVDGGTDLEEVTLANWGGFEGHAPVRVGNAAALHKQHDVFGEMVLALAPIFLDERFQGERSPAVLKLLERLAQKAIAVAGTPDAGIWEYRKAWQPQTFSNLMCWAAADRMTRILQRQRSSHADAMQASAQRIHDEIVQRSWSEARHSFTAAYGGSDLDAALLQMAPLRFVAAGDRRLTETISSISSELSQDGWLFRYRSDDGLGVPSVAFVICTFWMIEALALSGRIAEARHAMAAALSTLSPLGLLSEDLDVTSRRMWGNFPQAYSHVGLIHAAFAASPPWSEVL